MVIGGMAIQAHGTLVSIIQPAPASQFEEEMSVMTPPRLRVLRDGNRIVWFMSMPGRSCSRKPFNYYNTLCYAMEVTLYGI